MKIYLTALVAFTALFSSCVKGITGGGPVVTETRNVDTVNTIQLEGTADVEIMQGATQRVTVSGYQNLVSFYTTEVTNGNLILRFSDVYYSVRKNNIKVVITVPDIRSVKSNGSGNINISNFQHKNYLYSFVNGSGNIYINNSSFAKVLLSVNGSGNIRASTTDAQEAEAEIHGSGTIEISCSKKFSAQVYGSGNIDYWGTPPATDIHVSGSGKIRKR